MKHFNLLKALLLAPLAILLCNHASAQLSGTYTIGGTSPDYATLAAAVADLNASGVSGPVTFNIRSGSYTDQAIVNNVAGASATNRIVFRAETGNPADVTITNSASSTTNNYVFKLNGAKWVTIRDLSMVTTNNIYCIAVDFAGSSSKDSLVNCVLTGPNSNYTYYYAALVNSHITSASDIVIKGNTLQNGGTGVWLYGNSGAKRDNFIIEDNIISGMYYAPVYLYYTSNTKVRNNTITTISKPYGYVVYNYYGYDAQEITGNTATLTGVTYYYGLNNYNCIGSATDPAKRPLIANNNITVSGVSSSNYIAYNQYCNYVTLDNNTTNLTGATSTNYVYMFYYCNNCVVKNSTYNATFSSSLGNGYMFYQSHGSSLENNTFNFTSTGSSISLPYYYTNDFAIKNNTYNIQAASTAYGIYWPSLSGYYNGTISGNKINVTSNGSTVYGIYMSSLSNINIYNNVVNTSTPSTNYTTYLTSITSGGVNNVYNNIFHSRATGSTNYSFYMSPSSGSMTHLRNNVFSRTGTTGVACYIGNSTLSTSDYNLFYAPSGNIAQCTSPSFTASYTNLQGWRNSTGDDKNSLVHDPGYINSTNNLAPDVNSANSWARNGRGVQMPGNGSDINGNPRSVTLTDGVPDIGAYEFTPASTPPAAAATPAAPVANGTQVFTLGQDTVATIAWGASVPASITIRQYTGTQPPGISSLSGNNMYFYTDISIPSGTYGHTSNLYYKDPWMASIGSEHALRLAKKDGANAWVAYASPGSTVNATRNIISTTGTNNFGLHTGIDQGDNAGMNAVVSPVKPFCTGNQSVTVQVKNTGNNVLNNVQIGWMVDGVPQTPVGYNTPINTLGSGLGNTATVTLGNVVFGAAPRTIQAWTYSPNGNNDAFKTDDTVTVVLRSSLNGTYTIGGTTPNYTTIAAAVTDLNLYGVCGPVVFDIRNGTYTAQTTLKPVIGASAVNTITFKSETNNAANVTVQASLSSSNNFLIKFDSAEHFIFRLLTLKSTNTSYGYILNYAGTASHNTVRDCDIQIAGTSASGRAAVYANTTFFGTGNTIRDNIVTGGYYGVYLNGTTSNYLNGFTVENNNFSNIYYYGVYAYYTNRFKYLNNSLDINTSSSTCYGANLYYCDKLDLSGNTMNVTKSSGSLYGMYLYSSHGDVADSVKIQGNDITLTKTSSSGQMYPLYFGNGSTTGTNSYVSFSNNTVDCQTPYYLYNYGAYGLANSAFNGNDLTFNSASLLYNYLGYYWTNVSVQDNIMNASGGNSSATTYLALYCNNLTIRNNTINTSGASTTYNYIPYGSTNCLVEGNILNATSTSSVAYAMYNFGTSTPGTYGSNVINANKVKGTSGSSTAYGYYAYYSDNEVITNNVFIAQTNGTGYAFQGYYNMNNKFYNNAFIKKGTGGGYCAFFYNTAANYHSTIKNNVFYNGTTSGSAAYYVYGPQYVTSDYNNIFTNTTNKVQTLSSSYTNLQDWRSASSQDRGSIMYDPGFTNPANDDYTPDPANAASWSLNGRGVHIGGNNTDINGNTRVTAKSAGVPDIGPYEFTPSVVPPVATAVPAASTAGTTQHFLFGQDTVASVNWAAAATVPSSIDVRQWTGTLPPTFLSGTNAMYFYTDIATPTGTYNHDVKVYFKDPWTGYTVGKSGLRLAKKDGTNPWILHSSPQSATNANLNWNMTTGLTTFGYHTMTDVPNNASAAELVEPNGYFCAPSVQPIKVKIKNNGNNILTSVKIGWSVNNVPQTPITYTTPINVYGSTQGNEAIITLGNYNITTSAPYNLVVYTYLPNNVTDPAPGDDTLKTTIQAGLNGPYTVGGATPDYPDVTAAINAVNKFGVCGPVTFNIRTGTYTTAGQLGNITGASTTNTVTFRAETGVAANVTVSANPSGLSDNYVFGFNNTSHVILRNLTITNSNTSYGRVIDFRGTNNNDSIIDCVLQGPSTTSSSAYLAVIHGYYYENPVTLNNCGIIGNTIQNGSAGIYLYATTGEKNVIDDNTITSYYYGMYLLYLNATKIRDNNITITSTGVGYALLSQYNNSVGTVGPEASGNTIISSAYPYGIYLYGWNATAAARGKISKNKVTMTPTQYTYGINLSSAYYCDMDNNDISINSTNYTYSLSTSTTYYCRIFNNVANVSAGTGASYATQSMYHYYDTIYNNTFNINSSTGTSYGGYFYLYSGNIMRNNVISNKAGGVAMYMYNAGGTTNICDYNNIYTTSTSQFVTGNGTYATLQAYRTGSGFDRNSLSYDPGFVSNTDLHPDPNNPASWSLNGRGVHMPGNDIDKEGNPRVTTLAAGVPDIGAYEFVPNTTPPLAVATPATPAVGKQVFTFGQDTVAAITWKPNTQIPNTINVRQYTGTQPPNFPNTGKMYFYVDVNGANSTYDYTGDVYYKDPWRGTTSATETNLRMVKKLTPGSWQAYNGTLSSVNASLNILKANMTDLGMMSGIDDGILFSAIVTPGGNLIFCPGGSVTLHANSGAGYTYQWTYNTVNIPGATAPSYVATAAGDYAVKITDPNNITATSNPILVTIIAPPAAQVSASGPLTYCTGGNLTLNAATAPGQFYQWYLNGNQIPGATQSNYNVTTHGNYTVMVKNSGCSSTSPIQVVSEGPLHVNLGTDTSFCEGTPLTLDAGYPGASYQWSDGTNGQSIQISNKNQSGTYWVSVNAGPNCQDVDTIHVTVNPLPSVIGISYVKNNNTYYFEPSGPADVNSYLWMFDDGTTDTAKKPVKVYNTPEFEVKLVVFNACGTDTVILKLPLAVSNLAAGDVNVKVYPNPASSRITLSTEGTSFSGLSVINDLGQTVYRSSLEGDRTSEDVDVSSLANGHYFIRATATDGSTINKPFNIVR